MSDKATKGEFQFTPRPAREIDCAEEIDRICSAFDTAWRMANDAPSDVPSPSQSATSAKFGDYELIEEVARGGMGVIYRARHVSLDRI